MTDTSPKGYALNTVGQIGFTTGTPAGIALNGGGHLTIPAFKENYSSLAKGFTIEAVFTTGNDIQTNQSLVSNMHAGGYGLDMSGGQLSFSVRSSTGSYIGASAPIVANTTYHVVAVFDGTSVQLYIDGTQMATTAFSGRMTHPTATGAQYLAIGADSSEDGRGEYPATATLYAVRIYTQAASAGQALYLYLQTTA